MELLQNLYAIHAPSGNEKRLRKFIRKWLETNVPEVRLTYDMMGNMYMVKGEAETYPCVVAHLDQVQRNHSADFRTYIDEGVIFGYSLENNRYEGLGADDKNGIWIALKCLQRFDVLKVAFFNQEEVGCVGSSKANMEFFKDCRFVVQPDRRGAHDLITEIGWSEICSKEFLEDLDADLYGYVATGGLMTDVQELSERGVGISCINLSCGYYNPHTDQETTNIEDLVNCYNFVAHIIETCTKAYPHEYDKYSCTSYRWRGNSYGGYAGSTSYYGNYYDDYYERYYGYGGNYDTKEDAEESSDDKHYTSIIDDPYIPDPQDYHIVDEWLSDYVGYNFENFYPEDLWPYVEDILEGTMTKATFVSMATELWEEFYNYL